MSRVGKMPVEIADKVKAKFDNGVVFVEGPKGKLNFEIKGPIDINIGEKEIIVTRRNEEKTTRAMHGMTRAMINNMVIGVSEGFSKTLEIIGVGYRAESKGKELVLNLGFSHPVTFALPEGIDAQVDKQNKITLTGCDKQVVGETAAKIRKFRPPEPYKGKGIRYLGEVVKQKVGKAAAAGA